MIVASLLAGLAAWLAVGGPLRASAAGGRGRPLPWAVGHALVVVGVAASLRVAAGATWGSLAAALAIVAGGVTAVVRARRRAAARDRRADEIARACDALAQEILVGRIPAVALEVAAADFPVLRQAARVAAVGGDVVPVWHQAGQAPGGQGLARVARAWEMTRTTGAPLAATLAAVAERLRDERAVAGVVSAELAAARMSGRLLAVLPAAGLGIGYVIGGNPLGFLVGHPVGQGCLLGGSALMTAGLLWTEHLGRGEAS